MNIFLVSPENTQLAEENCEFTDKILLALKKRGCGLVKNPKQANIFILKEVNSFKEWRYINRLANDLFIGKYLDKVYTINTDDCATGLLRGIYTSLPLKRFNKTLHSIVPYSSYPNDLVLKADLSQKTRLYLASWRGNLKSNYKFRLKLVNEFVNYDDCKMELTTSWLDHSDNEKWIYVNLILSSMFSLCPGGWAPVSFRIYESMALGVVPVIISDQCILPDGPDWEKCSIKIQERCLKDLHSILKRLSFKYGEMGVSAKREWERHFSPSVLADYYADRLMRCFIKNYNKSSIKLELKRIKSFSNFWNNSWTIPQRLLNRINRFRENTLKQTQNYAFNFI